MPIAKVDARSFNYAKQIDWFLRPPSSSSSRASRHSMSPPPDSPDGVTPASPVHHHPPPLRSSSSSQLLIETETQLWKDLTSSQDAVTSYIICLIAKLISLDSGQSNRPLPDVYKEITEMHVDISKYRQWMSKEKQLQSQEKVKALSIQHAILATIHFLKQFYGFSPSLQLRNMYLRWNLARNYTIDNSGIADTFEVTVMTPFSVAASKDIIRDPLPLSPCSSLLSSSEEEERLVHELISDCYKNHQRSFFGTLPPDVCKLLNYALVAKSLSYIRLKDLVSRNPSLIPVALNRICFLLHSEISHSQDYGQREVLLPLVLLLKELMIIASEVDYIKVHQTLMPFYMWPSSHSDTVKTMLNIVEAEKKVKGSSYRRRLLMEHDLGLKLKHNSSRPRSQSVVLLVDTSHPESLGHYLYQSFTYHQEKPSSSLIKKLLLRSVLHSAPLDTSIDLTDLDRKISRLSEEQLTQLCEEGLDITEEAASMETGSEADQFLMTELSKLSQTLSTLAIESDEQRDSAFSSTSEDPCPPSFPLPPPYMPVHQLESVNFATVMDKMREILNRLQERPCPPGSADSSSLLASYPMGSITYQRPALSQTSLDSTGSGTLLETSSVSEVPNGIGLRSSFELTSISEQWNDGEGRMNGGGLRPTSPAAKSDPGLSHLQVRPPVSHLTVGRNHSVDGECFGSQDDTSDTSSRTSEEAVSRYSTDSPRPRPVLERRHTENFSSSGGHYLQTRRSTLGKVQMGSYSNQATSPISGSGSLRVKHRPNPSNSLRLKNRKIQPIAAVLSGPGGNPGKSRIIKFVIAGDDDMISNAAKAFTQLRSKEPNLFWGLEIEFHYIPLSQTSSGLSPSNVTSGSTSGSVPVPFGSGDLPEPANESKDVELGGDVLIGRYLSHMDSWYEQNVMLAVHNVMRLLPNDSLAVNRAFSSVENLDTRWSAPPTPSKILIDITSHFIREATHSIRVKMFKVKMTLRSEKSVKGFEHREMFMFHRFDVQKLSGKKNQRQAKPFETSLVLTELSLDNSFIRGELTQHKDVWIISGSNLPHPTDSVVSNPENECLELRVIKCQAEGGRLSQTKYRATEEGQYHVYELQIEAKDKPLSVIIDGDVASITENVIRIEVAPAYIDQGIIEAPLRRTERHERQMHFPLMSFWQVDL